VDTALRSFEFWLTQYRRVWRGSVVTSIVNPVFYLAALGVGLGTLVNKTNNLPGGISYLQYVAPGMLAATAMQVAATESSWPVHGAIVWTRQYQAMLATPLGIRDVLAGHQLFAATRVAVSAAMYLVAIALFGGVESPLAVLTIPVAILIGTAFSAPIAAYSAHVPREQALPPLFRFAIVPMFLFSGTFFPVTQLPEVLQWVAYATPLWHGVVLCRDLTLGTTHALADLGHAAYLLLWTLVGLRLAFLAYKGRLVR
jgi:lipooligosaccharide transport system permease protein